MKCPVCDSHRIVVLLNSQRRAFCATCGARWNQDGTRRWDVRGRGRTTPGAHPSARR